MDLQTRDVRTRRLAVDVDASTQTIIVTAIPGPGDACDRPDVRDAVTYCPDCGAAPPCTCADTAIRSRDDIGAERLAAMARVVERWRR